MYGSSLMLVTRMLRDSRIAARDAAAIPFPREDTTPPVTKTYFAIYLARVGIDKSTGSEARRKMFGGVLEPAPGGLQSMRTHCTSTQLSARCTTVTFWRMAHGMTCRCRGTWWISALCSAIASAIIFFRLAASDSV